MIRVLVLLALCVLAVLPQRVCTCHGVDIGRDVPVEAPAGHDHDCPSLEGGTFGECLKAADVPDTLVAFAEVRPVTTASFAHIAPTLCRAERPAPANHVPLYISLLTLRI